MASRVSLPLLVAQRLYPLARGPSSTSPCQAAPQATARSPVAAAARYSAALPGLSPPMRRPARRAGRRGAARVRMGPWWARSAEALGRRGQPASELPGVAAQALKKPDGDGAPSWCSGALSAGQHIVDTQFAEWHSVRLSRSTSPCRENTLAHARCLQVSILCISVHVSAGLNYTNDIV